MDKIQSKLVELSDNLTALSICLADESECYSDIILFLQYDVPMESSNEQYKKLKRVSRECRGLDRETKAERNESLKLILRRLQRFIIKNDRNGSQAMVVYKEAYDMAEAMIHRLNKESHSPISTKFAPYSQKAAL